jgi:RNA polymerase sigma-70 factor (ECF subfamily)
VEPGELAAAAQAGVANHGSPPAIDDAAPLRSSSPAIDAAAPPRSSPSTSERRAAVAELMRAHGEAVFGFCLRMVRTRAAADDLVQQVFLEAYRDLDRFEGRASPRAWLFGIARHRCLDLLRRQGRRAQLIESDEAAMLEVVDPGPGPTDQVDRRLLTAALEDCLRRLSPEVRATVLLRFQTEATYDELTAVLAATADALQVRVARALKGLRRCMERKGWTGE